MDHSLKAWETAAKDAPLAALARAWQAQEEGILPEAVDSYMANILDIMRQSVLKGLDPSLKSMSGMTGGQAALLDAARIKGQLTGGSLLSRAATKALAVAECNAAMGKIVAAPTAGACGILPAALLTMQEEYHYTDAELIDALLVAGVIGQVIAKRSSISGAQGGCQAECGSAAAMAAGAMVSLRGGSARQAFDACAFALMNSMGLVCDPVRGLVEVPCVYRNVGGIANALTAADLALAGIPCPLPPDEVIDAMKAVGDAMPASLRETGDGGCAACPSACSCK